MEMKHVKLLIIHILFLIVNRNFISIEKIVFSLLVLELNLPDKDELKAIGINTKQRFGF
jgi:hypothetical protein